jgi:hypothetical protein
VEIPKDDPQQGKDVFAFNEKNIIRVDDFDLVWWDGMRKV